MASPLPAGQFMLHCRHGVLERGTSIDLEISLDPVTYHAFVDLGTK
jgi:hypothetical protein